MEKSSAVPPGPVKWTRGIEVTSVFVAVFTAEYGPAGTVRCQRKSSVGRVDCVWARAMLAARASANEIGMSTARRGAGVRNARGAAVMQIILSVGVMRGFYCGACQRGRKGKTTATSTAMGKDNGQQYGTIRQTMQESVELFAHIA